MTILHFERKEEYCNFEATYGVVIAEFFCSRSRTEQDGKGDGIREFAERFVDVRANADVIEAVAVCADVNSLRHSILVSTCKQSAGKDLLLLPPSIAPGTYSGYPISTISVRSLLQPPIHTQTKIY